MAYIERKCDCCQKKYMADERNLKRGWGLTCSKSCAASKREQSKSTYDPKRVAFNNYRRENWNSNTLDKGFGDKSFADGVEGEKFKGIMKDLGTGEIREKGRRHVPGEV